MQTSTAIIIHESARGYRVHTPFKHSEFVAAFKRTVGGRWYAESGEWFIPADKLEWTIELLGHWFKLPVLIERAAPVVTETNEREALIARINAAWSGKYSSLAIALGLTKRFGVNHLSMLATHDLRAIISVLK